MSLGVLRKNKMKQKLLDKIRISDKEWIRLRKGKKLKLHCPKGKVGDLIEVEYNVTHYPVSAGVVIIKMDKDIATVIWNENNIIKKHIQEG